MYAYCTSSHMSKQFKKWPIKFHFGWLSWPAKTRIKYCTLKLYNVMIKSLLVNGVSYELFKKH